MSRNVEKAQSGLNRYHQDVIRKAGALETNPSLRPKVVQKVQSLPQAEKWRSIVLSEISVRLTRIQDLSRTEYDIRQINDELNKLFKEKRAWEYHIKHLGGPDYLTTGQNMESTGELDIFSNIKGYRYYGRAKELPDVKQLLDAKRRKLLEQSNRKPQNNGNKHHDIYHEKLKHLDANYFSKFEDNITNNVRDQVVAAFGNQSPNDAGDKLDAITKKLAQANKHTTAQEFKGFSIPSNEEISQWLIDKRKQDLLHKLANNT